MARPRAATYDDQRAHILRAAAALFAQRGYTAATMNEVAAATGVSKATLYHYFSDKHALLEDIVRSHVARLELLAVQETPETPGSPDHTVESGEPGEPGAAGAAATPEARLRSLIRRFMQAYADAQSEHRVLTEDVKFLGEAERQAVLNGQRRVVRAFARAVGGVRPDLQADGLDKPLAMLLFGMINWTFTWLRSGGPLTHESLAPLVVGLFLGGLDALRPVPAAALAPVG